MRACGPAVFVWVAIASVARLAAAQGPGPSGSGHASPVAGAWCCQALDAFLEIADGRDGQVYAHLTVPGQNLWKRPAGPSTFRDGELVIDASVAGGTFRARLVNDGKLLRGKWEGAKGSREIELERAASVPMPVRGPRRPFPYREEEVTFENERAGITFYATLTLPEGPGPHPVAVLITGAGCQDRDETLGPASDPFFKPFLIVSDALTRRGVAVLRYDDRGWGKTRGSVLDSTSEDSASDALAAVRFLRRRPDIDRARVGLIGHSEGGMVAMIAASWQQDFAFVVSLAGVAQRVRPLAEQLLERWLVSKRVPGLLKGVAKGHLARIVKVVESDATDAEVAERLKTMVPSRFIPHMSCKWSRFMVKYDPGPAIERVRCPILGLFATEDVEVPAITNADALRAACFRGGNQDLMIVTYAGMNHFFRYNAPPPLPRPGWDGGVAADVLEDLTRWVEAKVTSR